MNITIYEDQTGLMLFPDKKTDKNIQIVSFFNNNIDLYVDKSNVYDNLGNNMTIYCHLIALEASSRPLGYYIVYKNVYDSDVFSNFKRDVGRVLGEQGISPRIGHEDNIIFENIDVFDRGQYNKEDINIIKEAIRTNKIEYSSGDIREISAFCNNVLRDIEKVGISIASTRFDMGNINILLNKKQTEPLRREGSTETIINNAKYAIKQNKKKIDGTPGITKINGGLREGVPLLKNAGYTNGEIKTEIDSIMVDILKGYSNLDTSRLERSGFTRRDSDIEKGFNTEKGFNSERRNVKDTTNSEYDNTIGGWYIFAIVGILMVGSLSYLYLTSEPRSLGGMIENIKSFVPGYEKQDVGKEPGKELPRVDPANATYKRNNATNGTYGRNNMTNDTGVVQETETVNINSPTIYSFYPETTTNLDMKNIKLFSISTSQTVNFTWYVDGEKVQDDLNMNIAKYENIGIIKGAKSIKVVAENTNGKVSKEWFFIQEENKNNITNGSSNVTNDSSKVSTSVNSMMNSTIKNASNIKNVSQ